jgi:hypothetical protein
MLLTWMNGFCKSDNPLRRLHLSSVVVEWDRRITLGDRANEFIPGIPKHILSADQAAFRDIQFLDSGVHMFDEYKRAPAIAPPRPQTAVDVPLQVLPTDGQEIAPSLEKIGRPETRKRCNRILQVCCQSMTSGNELLWKAPARETFSAPPILLVANSALVIED